VLPVLMTASCGLSIFMSTLQNSFLGQYLFFTPLMELFLHIAPYINNWKAQPAIKPATNPFTNLTFVFGRETYSPVKANVEQGVRVRGELSGAGAGGSDHRGRFDFVVLYGDQLDLTEALSYT